MCQLRSDILRKKKQVEIEKAENLYKRSNIATPIQTYNSNSENESNDEYNENEIIDNVIISDNSDDSEDNSNDDDIENSNNEGMNELNEETRDTLENNDEPDAINSTEQWVNTIQNWISMIGDENSINEDPLEFIAVDRTIHPADDQLAKWDLLSIFNNRLEAPSFVKSLINLDK
jgi:hypothetical protein